MVGLIFVSHSNELAKNMKKYIYDITKTEVPIGFSGGVGDDFKELGTDPTDIYNLIEEMYTDDGIIIFCDLGSALISSEMAISMLDDDKKEKVKLTSAPFLEGGILAAIEASLNKNIDEIKKELNNSLDAKKSYIDDDEEEEVEKNNAADNNLKDYIRQEYKILLKNGLHARPIFMFMNMVSKSNCSVLITNKTKNKNIISADSMSKISLLNIQYNDIVEVYAKGEEAQKFLENVKDLFDGKFEVADNEIKKAYAVNSDFEIVCEGNVSALAKYVDLDIKIGYEEQRDIDIKAEKEKFVYAIETVRKEILKQKQIIENKNLCNDEALIFDSHLSMLLDEAVINDVDSLLETSKHTALYLYTNIMQNMYDCFDEFDDLYMRERKYDILDILNQVLAVLLDKKVELPKNKDIILISDNIYVSTVANFTDNIKGVISLNGSSLSHSSILLKALNIPYVVYKDAKKFDGKNIVIDTKNKDIIYLKN
ncbi:dihydroxyacetone kinase phosphoryl donor subunit DhaM [Brachyspira pilosicoli]|uniref:dihydroxyacetone kinase phosphoryl donor subunit DhaM n=1 Tax=Brachyspira pilosicoli TaxID=52584 RepID=UPI0030064798